MLRGFRHRLFLLLQAGIVLSGAVAWFVHREAWAAIAIAVAGSVGASIICERLASVYLRNTLGRLRRVADGIGQGRYAIQLATQPGDDFHKLVKSINQVANRLAEAGRAEAHLQDELRRRERLAFLGELAATVAHEVNNPLDGLQSCTRILRRSLDDPRRSAHMLDLIDSGLERIELIVRRLLTLARHNVIRPTPVPLREVLEAAVRAVRTRLEARGITVVWHEPVCDDPVDVDSGLLEQVFVNLLVNAADSMAEGGEITLTIQPADPGALPERGVEVCVADCGSGIPDELLPHIFEPFFTTKSGGRGTGLGLPIAARIVDAHRGRIEVRPRPGGGTEVAVLLPFRQIEAEVSQAPGLRTAATGTPISG